MTLRVLVVEDDDGIAVPLMRTLERENYDVTRADAGAAAIGLITNETFDLVLLDLGLPDIDGLDVCRRVRADGFEGGIMILTARGEELDRVVGLDVGADDYLAKPFALAELLARTRALMRRTARPASAAPAPTDGLRIDDQARRVWVRDEEIALTSKEYDVLALLARTGGAVIKREQLMDEVWDANWFGSTKVLDVTIARLRQKLEDNDAPWAVVTVRGIGFRLGERAGDA